MNTHHTLFIEKQQAALFPLLLSLFIYLVYWSTRRTLIVEEKVMQQKLKQAKVKQRKHGDILQNRACLDWAPEDIRVHTARETPPEGRRFLMRMQETKICKSRLEV